MASWLEWSTVELMSPMILDLLPELSDEEQQRLRWLRRLPERLEGIHIPRFPPLSVAPPGTDDARIMPTARNALHLYNARHPGGEFDAVKPLSEKCVRFRDETWTHVNFWARSRTTRKIKRFFAEVHYKYTPFYGDPSVRAPRIVTVETCSIIEEPLAPYKRSCAFCELKATWTFYTPWTTVSSCAGAGTRTTGIGMDFMGSHSSAARGEPLPFPFCCQESMGQSSQVIP